MLEMGGTDSLTVISSTGRANQIYGHTMMSKLGMNGLLLFVCQQANDGRGMLGRNSHR